MLLTRQRFKRARPELNMGAMIDVVFLLLIFFMCTTSFKTIENDLSAQLPQVSSKTASLEDFEPIRIRLSGTAEAVHITCDEHPCSTFAALVEQLQARRAIVDIPVIIDGQDEIPFGYMVKALDACYEAHLERAAFSAKGAQR